MYSTFVQSDLAKTTSFMISPVMRYLVYVEDQQLRPAEDCVVYVVSIHDMVAIKSMALIIS
jgi:hypothetical protein